VSHVELNQAVIQALSELGRGDVPSIPAVLADERTAWKQIVNQPGSWRKLAAELPADDLAALIRGLVLYGRAGRRTGGSVSPVISLFRAFVERFPAHHAELAGWVVDHTSNVSEPWGSTALRTARSLSDVRAIEAAREVDRQASLAAEDLRRAEAASRRAREATENLPKAVRRGDVKAVAALLATGANPQESISRVGSLVAIAREHGRGAMIEYLRSAGIE
jgi:hypothetical protein